MEGTWSNARSPSILTNRHCRPICKHQHAERQTVHGDVLAGGELVSEQVVGDVKLFEQLSGPTDGQLVGNELGGLCHGQ
jgi:hypothetical protein